MPTYDFKCPKGHVHERFYQMSSAPRTVSCKVCSELAVRQIGAGGSIIFRGTGFYETDYKRKKK